MEKLKLNNTQKLNNELTKELNYDIDNADTTCPSITCGKNRFYLAFYNDEVVLVCRDCGYHQRI